MHRQDIASQSGPYRSPWLIPTYRFIACCECTTVRQDKVEYTPEIALRLEGGYKLSRDLDADGSEDWSIALIEMCLDPYANN